MPSPFVAGPAGPPSSIVLPELIITAVRPQVDGGRRLGKATQGEILPISATIFAEGQPTIRARVHFRSPSPSESISWSTATMELDPVEDNHWDAPVVFRDLGEGEFQIEAWQDYFGSWRVGLVNWMKGGVDLGPELISGVQVLTRQLRLLPTAEAERWSSVLERAQDRGPDALRRFLLRRDLSTAMASVPSTGALRSEVFPVWIERPLAGCGAWYEFFPRSEGSDGQHSGTFATAARRLPGVAEMGFDVVYLPPIHPIGSTGRKGKNSSVPAGPDDPGSPWAIGAAAGGHTAIHPDLGTEADFREFIASAQALKLEVALDYALQCSPDHPWVTEHPDWFLRRPDGSIRPAENPPKRYQDVFPLDFLCRDRDGLWGACYQILEHWIGQGVKVFRVDNPHTKPLAFWDWTFRRLRSEHPEVIMLAEAFTKPPLMYELSKLGFSQSYTFFTWRTSKAEITLYMEELTRRAADFFRPNFFVNTPDILSKELVKGGPPAFRSRLLLAATLSPSYGVYAGYEHFEREPESPDNEEYFNSEKFEYRVRDWSAADSLTPLITELNRIRRDHPALRQLRRTDFHPIGNPWLVAYSRRSADGEDTLLVIINTDPRAGHQAMLHLNLRRLGISRGASFRVTDLLSGLDATWRGPAHRVSLDTEAGSAQILWIRP